MRSALFSFEYSYSSNAEGTAPISSSVVEQYEYSKLNNAFLTLQCCMNSIIDCGGDNSYKIVHMGKGQIGA
jgi:hypothetical protein